MSDSLGGHVLDALSKSSRPLSTLEVAKAVGLQTRKQINPTLYGLEREGKVRKVGETPAMWTLKHPHLDTPQQSVSLASRDTTGKGMGYRTAQRAVVGHHSQTQHSEDSQDSNTGRILAYLGKATNPVTALDVAKALGYQSRKAVNPLLYGMEKDGLIHLIEGQGAPQWQLPPHSQKVSLQNAPFASGEPQSPHLEEMDVSPSNPFLPMEHSHEPNTSSDGGPTDVTEGQRLSLEEGILAELRSMPGVRRTSLELSKSVGKNVTRQQVNTCMEKLQLQGKVRSTSSLPVQWSINEETASSAAESSLHSSASQNSVSDLTANPVSSLSEYCQSMRYNLTFPTVREFGPDHRKMFVIAAKFGTYSFEAESSSKKEAKRIAADLALQHIRASKVSSASYSSQTCLVPTAFAVQEVPQSHSFSDQIKELSYQCYIQLEQGVECGQPGRKVIAAFIMENTETNTKKVVSVGSGTHCITGDQMNPGGLVVNDSHAEVVARRSLMRFFYLQLLAKSSGHESIFTESENPQLMKVQDVFKFHLFISTAPCGDSALFSREDNDNREPPDDNCHHPTMLNKKQGVLRTKMEGGEGTIPVPEESMQTWDGILHGQRLRTMSCSDKIARWNVLGLQGALLSCFMEPVYMSSLILGSLHHHGHLARAVCCRVKELQDDLPHGFVVNHPTLGRAAGGDEMKRHTEKTSTFSLNWALGDEKAELTDGTKGRPVSGQSQLRNSTQLSRICKANMFSMFVALLKKNERNELSNTTTYKDAKQSAVEYQQAKAKLFALFKSKGYGTWMKKPEEQELFTIANLMQQKLVL